MKKAKNPNLEPPKAEPGIDTVHQKTSNKPFLLSLVVVVMGLFFAFLRWGPLDVESCPTLIKIPEAKLAKFRKRREKRPRRSELYGPAFQVSPDPNTHQAGKTTLNDLRVRVEKSPQVQGKASIEFVNDGPSSVYLIEPYFDFLNREGQRFLRDSMCGNRSSYELKPGHNFKMNRNLPPGEHRVSSVVYLDPLSSLETDHEAQQRGEKLPPPRILGSLSSDFFSMPAPPLPEIIAAIKKGENLATRAVLEGAHLYRFSEPDRVTLLIAALDSPHRQVQHRAYEHLATCKQQRERIFAELEKRLQENSDALSQRAAEHALEALEER